MAFGAAPTSRVGEEAFGENLRTIVSRSSDLGVEVVLIEHWAPPVYTVKDLSAELGVPLVRAQGRFNKVKRETGEELFLPKHHHPNAAGYAVLTREIARVFRRELSESSTGTAEVQADLP